jgi:predicted RNA-binding Zn ribbon-like protein
MMAAAGSAGGLPAPAPGEDTSSALALVNTRLMVAGQPADLVSDGASASGWLAERGLVPRGTPVDDAGAARLGALREAVRSLFEARAGGHAPLPGDVSLLNAALATAPLAPALAWDDGGPRRGEQPLGAVGDPVGFALARLAGDALGLLTRPSHAAPARCGAHGCIRWYLRMHAARQWCSDRCGDRVRAARHYARRQADADDLPAQSPLAA